MHDLFSKSIETYKKAAKRKALGITLIYALIGSIYILISDKLVNIALNDPEAIESVSIIKGWIYVFATALLIFLLVYPPLKKISEASGRLNEMNAELQKKEAFNKTVMDNLPIGISVNSAFPRVEFVYMNDKFPAIYQTSREELTTPDSFWEAVYQDAEYRDMIKQRVLNDIASGDPKRMHWDNVPIVRKGKETRYISAYGTPVPGEKMLISTVMDVTERRKAEKNLLYLSYHDHLTDLYNRRYFETELERLDSEKNLPITILMADLNGLKLINDSFGHQEGDRLLKRTAEIIKKVNLDGSMIARIGGDEFAVVLLKKDRAEAERMIARIEEQTIAQGFDGALLSVSFGFATKYTKTEKMQEVLALAENYMYKQKIYKSASMRNKTIDVIMNALFEKSEREMQHSKRVSKISAAIAVELGFSQDDINKITMSGLVHDIGKIGIDEKVLNKAGKLDEEEWAQIKKHPEAGWRILASVNEFSDLAKHILCHQEKWDGSGYPKGLRGEEITIEARIIALADAFDAMTKDRSYRKGMSNEEAITELNKYAGTQFDPQIVEVFVNKVLPKGIL